MSHVQWGKEKRETIEQCNDLCQVLEAKVGIATDNSSFIWFNSQQHNKDNEYQDKTTGKTRSYTLVKDINGGEFIKEFAHYTVNHGAGEYVNGDAHTNTAEGFFSILKRGINGVYHHVSEQHLERYLVEFGFRYDNRKVEDAVRASIALEHTKGKRLTYKVPCQN